MISENQYNIEPFTDEETERYRSVYKADPARKLIRVNGFVLPEHFVTLAQERILSVPLRNNDVFVVTVPRSGTTWTQELVWLVVNNLDFEKAKATRLRDRYVMLEFPIVFLEETISYFQNNYRPDQILAKVPEGEPRFIKSHLPLSLLPKGALDSTKVVYVARDPRDVAVSNYFFHMDNQIWGCDTDFKTFYYEIFCKDLMVWSPYFKHLKEAWAERNHPNLLFIFYEELIKDLKGVAKRVSKFLGKEYTEEQYNSLCDHLQFDNFKQNKAVFPLIRAKNFVRKGVTGGWRAHFDEEMSAHAQRWIDDNLRDTTITFPANEQS